MCVHWCVVIVAKGEAVVGHTPSFSFSSPQNADRLHTRPFLSPVERKWVAYQLIRALEQCHG